MILKTDKFYVFPKFLFPSFVLLHYIFLHVTLEFYSTPFIRKPQTVFLKENLAIISKKKGGSLSLWFSFTDTIFLIFLLRNSSAKVMTQYEGNGLYESVSGKQRSLGHCFMFDSFVYIQCSKLIKTDNVVSHKIKQSAIIRTADREYIFHWLKFPIVC